MLSLVPNVIPFKLDVTQSEDIIEAVKFVQNSMPEGKRSEESPYYPSVSTKSDRCYDPQGARLWGLVNNAGIHDGSYTEWCPMATYKRVADVNLWAVVELSKAFLPTLRQNGVSCV